MKLVCIQSGNPIERRRRDMKSLLLNLKFTMRAILALSPQSCLLSPQASCRHLFLFKAIIRKYISTYYYSFKLSIMKTAAGFFFSSARVL